MKFNVEVEIEWLGEDWTVDEKFEHELNKKLEEKLLDRLVESVDSDLVTKVSKRVNEVIDERINSFIDEFMDKGCTQGDRWGEVIKENVNPKELLKEKLDSFMTEDVDDKGKSTSDNWSSKKRYEYVIDKAAKEHIEKWQTGVSKDVLTKIKKDINEETRKKVVDTILSDYSLKKLIDPLA